MPPGDERVTIAVDGVEYANVRDYSLQSDILQLGDPFSCTIENDDGRLTGQIKIGAKLTVDFRAPEVKGGGAVKQMTGRVIRVRHVSSRAQGSVILVEGSDLGWHLNKSCGPLWLRLRRFRSFLEFIRRLIDPTWGFIGVEANNDANRALRRGLNFGRAGIIQTITINEKDFLAIVPPIQFESGQLIAPTLIEHARRLGVLLDVSADGQLLVFQPNYNQDPSYRIEYHRAIDESKSGNALDPVEILEDIEGVYTRVTCVGAATRPPLTPNPEDPNEGKIPGTHTDGAALPFFRYLSFSDADQFSRTEAETKARWRQRRGLFDSWSATYRVAGHTQISPQGVGVFWAVDTMCSVLDTVHKLDGSYYVSAVHFQRSLGDGGGTTTTVTLRRPNLLFAVK